MVPAAAPVGSGSGGAGPAAAGVPALRARRAAASPAGLRDAQGCRDRAGAPASLPPAQLRLPGAPRHCRRPSAGLGPRWAWVVCSWGSQMGPGPPSLTRSWGSFWGSRSGAWGGLEGLHSEPLHEQSPCQGVTPSPVSAATPSCPTPGTGGSLLPLSTPLFPNPTAKLPQEALSHPPLGNLPSAAGTELCSWPQSNPGSAVRVNTSPHPMASHPCTPFCLPGWCRTEGGDCPSANSIVPEPLELWRG